MAGACPKCGWQPVDGSACPRCGVDVAGYLAELAAGAPVSVPAALERRSGDPARLGGAPDLRPAGFWIRVVAVIIDTRRDSGRAGRSLRGRVDGVRRSVVDRDPGGRADVRRHAHRRVSVLFHWRWGQTLGKMAVDIRVVTCRPTPTSPGWPRTAVRSTLGCAALRQLASLLSSAILGCRLPDGRASARQAGLARSHRRHPRRAPPVTLPLPLRNRLAELVLEAFHDRRRAARARGARRRRLPESRTPRSSRSGRSERVDSSRGARWTRPTRRSRRPRPGRAPVRRSPLLRSA